MRTGAIRLPVAGNQDRSLRWSLAGHGLLLLIVLVGGFVTLRAPPPTELAIKGTLVESKPGSRPPRVPAPKSPAVPQPAPKPESKPEPKPAVKPEPKPEPKPAPPKPESKSREDPARAERQKVEERRTREAALKKQAEEKAATQEAARRKAAEEEAARVKAEQAAQAKAAEAKAAEAKAAEAKAEAERRRAARELEEQLAAEERLLAAADSGALQAYKDLIGQKVQRNWVRPASARPGIECVVNVTQIPGGEVAAVQIGQCNGDDAVRRSIEAAVLRASPLPLPEDPALFERNLRFTFKPEQ